MLYFGMVCIVVCIQVGVKERSPKPFVCLQYNMRRGGSGGCRVEVDAVVKRAR